MINLDAITRTVNIIKTASREAAKQRREAFEARMAAKKHPVDRELRHVEGRTPCHCVYAGCGLCAKTCYRDSQYWGWDHVEV